MARYDIAVILELICFFTCFYFVRSKNHHLSPFIKSVEVLNQSTVLNHNEFSVYYKIKIEGSNFSPFMKLSFTQNAAKRGKHCNSDVVNKIFMSRYFSIQKNITSSTAGYLQVFLKTFKTPLYLCVGVDNRSSVNNTHSGEVIKWYHQGDEVFLPVFSTIPIVNNIVDGENRIRRDTLEPASVPAPQQAPPPSVAVLIHGFRIESSDHTPVYGDDGVVRLLAHTSASLRLFGLNLSNTTSLGFTTVSPPKTSTCTFLSAGPFVVTKDSLTDHSALFKITVPGRTVDDVPYFLCVSANGTEWVHQGTENWLQIVAYEKTLPNWVTAIIIVCLLVFSALFSGLTLGLMSMDKTDLKIVCATGTELERKYASAIIPVRSHGSLLLCSLLLGNVLVNSVLTILMDDLTSGLIAVIFSTLAIVIFGEIMPQAICSRHGLAVGAKTIYITKFVILLTFVVAFPISKILDFMLGEEIGNVYNRERLKELVRTGADIEKDEVNIISGALELSKKKVADVMTKLEDVYMLHYEALLDFETVSDIMKSGFSRIPVFENKRSNIVSMLFIKDLAFVDPDDNTPLKTLCEFYQNPLYFVFDDMTLDVLFKQFKEGNKGHMAFVHRVNSEGEGDPFYETIGLITLEDVIEELIQAEIVDETDVWTDNRSKRKRERKDKQDFTTFAERRENQTIHISPQLTLATFQYLSTTVDAFKPPIISETILRRLLRQDVIHHIKNKNKSDSHTTIYHQGKPVDYFVLILEGRVEVIVGKEEMKFESGPFTYFGSQALTQNYGVADSPTATAIPSSNMGSLQSVNIDSIMRHTFVPDYSVRAITEVFYVRIKRSLYLAAKKATLMEHSQKMDDHFDDEVEKLLHSLDEDDRSQGQCSQDSPILTRALTQSDKDSLAGIPNNDSNLSSGSPRSHNPPSTNSSPHEPNGSVRTPLSPTKQRNIVDNKCDSVDRTSGSLQELEERTNLLSKTEHVS